MNTTITSLKYRVFDWGEIMTGTKQALQSHGLGIGRAFPGEYQAPKRVLRVIDPRGMVARIVKKPGHQFEATICYFGPIQQEVKPEVFLSGIRLTRAPHWDEFLGSAQALVAAGLCKLEQLPGMPGMRKQRVTVFADGAVCTASPTASSPKLSKRRHETGAKWIEKVGKSFKVCIHVDDAESERRRLAWVAADAERQKQFLALGQPPRLRPDYANSLQAMKLALDAARADSAFQASLARLVAPEVP